MSQIKILDTLTQLAHSAVKPMRFPQSTEFKLLQNDANGMSKSASIEVLFI
jgi:hypothetical protein